MGYKNMKKQKAHIKALRKREKASYAPPLTEREVREIENTIPTTHTND